ncbi:hypothetical protein LH51_18750 [Nitrincola sp. A-D6]|uniref:hypothetical protein n=1 Tax=Nitrincola sp. A-D6 TaxID=1545442 RepID=UPI00051FE14E|nr:hypothetical protein [Nitrincola sp. A-D6]KGK40903.1 hypothetical protein LH51_18750 [Nitrincola sp. A-D6]
MKKLLLGAVLMLASFTASAGTVTITNPTVIQGSGFITEVSTPTGEYIFGGDFFEASETVELSWNSQLTGFAQGLVNFSVSSSLDNWSLSVLDGGVKKLLTGNNAANTAVFAPFTKNGGTIYNLIMTGTTAISSFSVGFSYPVEVTQTPLPAAVWLFGSVLLGGLALRRRSKNANMQAVVA